MGGITAGLALGGFVGDQLFNSGDASDKLFGNNIPSELKNPRLTSFTSPGLNATFQSPEQLNVQRSQGVTDSLAGISSAYQTQAGELGALQPLVEPGFGRLTQAGINAVRDSRRASMGDLRQNLQRRRVLGSSFGADDISRTNAEFAKKEYEFGSQAFAQELAMSQDLINSKAQAEAASFAAYIDQANIESSYATQLSSGVSSILSNNARIIGDMSNAGAGNLIATTLGLGSLMV